MDAEQTSGRRLIPSAELTVGWDDGLEDSEEEKRHREAASVDNVSSIPTFPNVKWNTFSNRLRIDHRKKWKIEPDTSVGVDVIKQRYEQMVSRSNSKWSNLEDRFHVAKMIQKMSGLSRTGVLAAAAAAANKKKRGAASIAFADRAPESNAGRDQQSKVQDPAKGHSKTPAFDKAKRADDHQVLGSTAGMSRERREAVTPLPRTSSSASWGSLASSLCSTRATKEKKRGERERERESRLCTRVFKAHKAASAKTSPRGSRHCQVIVKSS